MLICLTGSAGLLQAADAEVTLRNTSKASWKVMFNRQPSETRDSEVTVRATLGGANPTYPVLKVDKDFPLPAGMTATFKWKNAPAGASREVTISDTGLPSRSRIILLGPGGVELMAQDQASVWTLDAGSRLVTLNARQFEAAPPPKKK
jgi:hypothetical protein